MINQSATKNANPEITVASFKISRKKPNNSLNFHPNYIWGFNLNLVKQNIENCKICLNAHSKSLESKLSANNHFSDLTIIQQTAAVNAVLENSLICFVQRLQRWQKNWQFIAKFRNNCHMRLNSLKNAKGRC